MGKKKINATVLGNVKNSYSDVSSSIKEVGEGLDGTASEAITNGNTAIKDTAGQTKEMLDSFDQYLSDVAAAFEDTDYKISQKISDPTPNTITDMQNTDAYKKLRQRDPSTPQTDAEARADGIG